HEPRCFHQPTLSQLPFVGLNPHPKPKILFAEHDCQTLVVPVEHCSNQPVPSPRCLLPVRQSSGFRPCFRGRFADLSPWPFSGMQNFPEWLHPACEILQSPRPNLPATYMSVTNQTARLPDPPALPLLVCRLPP